MQLQSLNFAVAKHRGYSAPVEQFHAFFEHVVQIFRGGGHLLRIGFHGDHGYFHRALAQGFTGAIDGSVSAADYGHTGSQLHFRCSHADVAKERKTVEHAVFVLSFGAHAVRLGETHGQHASIVVLFEFVPSDVLADFDIGLNCDPEFNQALDLAIKHVSGKHPVRDTPTIQTARLG